VNIEEIHIDGNLKALALYIFFLINLFYDDDLSVSDGSNHIISRYRCTRWYSEEKE
jgi:hypothetical protein